MDSSAMSEMRKPHNSNRVAAHIICNEEYKTVGSCHILDYILIIDSGIFTKRVRIYTSNLDLR